MSIALIIILLLALGIAVVTYAVLRFYGDGKQIDPSKRVMARVTTMESPNSVNKHVHGRERPCARACGWNHKTGRME